MTKMLALSIEVSFQFKHMNQITDCPRYCPDAVSFTLNYIPVQMILQNLIILLSHLTFIHLFNVYWIPIMYQEIRNFIFPFNFISNLLGIVLT